MTLRLRKGTIVYASKDMDSKDIFPGAVNVMDVFIGAGTKGKVVDAADAELPLVRFDNGEEWHVDINHISRRKPNVKKTE